MSVLDIRLSTGTIQRQRRPSRIRDTEAEPEDMPFAVHYDQPEPAKRTIWLLLATFAAILLSALV